MSPTVEQEVQPAWQNYLDLNQDLLPWLLAKPPIPAEEARLMTRVGGMACTWVQNYLARAVAPTTFFRRFSGWSGLNGTYIALPYYPVLEVKKVEEFWGISGPHVLTEQTPAKQGTSEMFQLVPLTGMLIRTFQGLVQRPFFPGSRNIEVTWVAGYDPIPDDIMVATLELAKHWWVNTFQAARDITPPGEYDTMLQGGPMFPGVPDRCRMLLAPYTQVGIG